MSRTGVVIVTHGDHGLEMLAAASAIVGEIPQVNVVPVTNTDKPELVHAKIRAAAASVDDGGGVLFAVDLHGSTPYRICDAFASAQVDAEIVSGLNLPMLIKLATCPRDSGPRALAELMKETGRRSIQVGCDMPGHPPRSDAEKR